MSSSTRITFAGVVSVFHYLLTLKPDRGSLQNICSEMNFPMFRTNHRSTVLRKKRIMKKTLGLIAIIGALYFVTEARADFIIDNFTQATFPYPPAPGVTRSTVGST